MHFSEYITHSNITLYEIKKPLEILYVSLVALVLFNDPHPTVP